MAGRFRLAAIGQEIAAAKTQEIDERDVASALETFGPVWDSLWATERSRILGLLVERIDYDGRTHTLELALRLGEIGRLHKNNQT